MELNRQQSFGGRLFHDIDGVLALWVPRLPQAQSQCQRTVEVLPVQVWYCGQCPTGQCSRRVARRANAHWRSPSNRTSMTVGRVLLVH